MDREIQEIASSRLNNVKQNTTHSHSKQYLRLFNLVNSRY